MSNKIIPVVSSILLFSALSCQQKNMQVQTDSSDTLTEKKIVVYQVFTRLFGNQNTTNKPWGTLEENG
ncbi:MAG: alpha-amylase, partial [Flavobacterium sp.]|nr:alpha-amylase [Flavobacterium sp.]